LRNERHNHVWSYDFIEERTHDGRKFRLLNIIDEFTHECLAIRVSRRLKSIDVIDVLSDLFILRCVPAHIRSDNGPEFVAKAVQEWIAGRRKDRLHHAGQSMGERLHRKLQRAPARPASRWRDLLHAARSRDRHRELATTLQYGSPACLDRLPGSGPGVFVPALAAWPAAQSRPAPPAMLPLVPRPTLN
jgi:putative transposase